MGEEAVQNGETILFRGRLTEEDVVALQRCYDRLLIRRPFRWLAGSVAVIMGGFSIAYLVGNGLEVVSIGFLLGSLYVLFGFRAERTWRVRQHYRRHPDDYLETELRLTLEWVSLRNETFRSEFAWKLLGGLMNHRTGILFYMRDRRAACWLPSRLFENNDLREQTLKMAEINGVPVRRG